MKLSVLVTGAGGMIGRSLLPVLSAKGHRVIAGVRKETKSLGHANEIVAGDFRDKKIQEGAFQALCADGGKTAVIHLAGVSGGSERLTEDVDFIQMNVLMTLRLIQAATEREVTSFMLASTGLVYGHTGSEAADEAVLPRPASLYAASKLAAEAVAHIFAKKKTTVEVLRFSNLYGPESPAHTVVGKVFQQIRGGEEVRILTKNPVRDFLFVEDAVEAVEALLTASVLTPGYRVTNVSSGEGTSIGDFVNAALMTVGARSQEWDLSRSEDSIVLSNRYLRVRTGWKPRHDLAEGIRKSLKKDRTEVLREK